MERFYSSLGWVVFLAMIAAIYLAYAAPTFDESVAVLWVAQIPLYAYITVGIALLFRAPSPKSGRVQAYDLAGSIEK